MTIRSMSTEELLGLDKFEVDEEEAHIVIDKALCAKCTDKVCLLVCPAVLYTLKDDEIHFDYAGCLECGTCRVMCKNKGITKWEYPRGSFGVSFRYG